MSPPTLAFLKVDARRPLDDASETLDDQNSKGFVKLAATIDPKFTGAHVAYDVMIASKATHVNVMASTLVPGCKISIDGVTGNMATRPASGPVSIVVESSSGEMTTYTLTVKVSSEMSNEGEVVMKEKPKVENAEPEHHGHSHDGVPPSVSIVTAMARSVMVTGTKRNIPTDTGTRKSIPTGTGTKRNIPTDTDTKRNIPTDTGTKRNIPTDTDTKRNIPTDTGTRRFTFDFYAENSLPRDDLSQTLPL
ncbi:hypothetical protein BE221DRAFT_78062 [Ostreococcus tauri]|uniref:Cadherin-like beta-sandwich-like domain-containing protein n=1 Tax=Ostreococcus tauri TaxID=70448 RepID=A0A1Y5I7I0_OSTTA|nr:hypothetical protein BE221DRAFT_78062 [Ostreococcus tauri]